jgi:hypothetical protein
MRRTGILAVLVSGILVMAPTAQADVGIATAPPSPAPSLATGTNSVTGGVQVQLQSPLSVQTDSIAASVQAQDVMMNDMQTQYGSLSTSLASYYATQSNKAVGEYITGSITTLGSVSGMTAGATPDKLAKIAAQASSGSSMADVNNLIVGAGIGLDFTRFGDLNTAVAEMRRGSYSLDASVTNAAAVWGQQMLSLKATGVTVPQMPQMTTGLATDMPAEGLAFGMFTNRALNTLVNEFPDVFSAIQGHGLDSATSKAAWSKSVDTAAAANAPQMRSLLPSDCGSAFVDGLTGNASSGGCTPCSASGLYAYSQLVTAGPFNSQSDISLDGKGSPSVSQSLSADPASACASTGAVITDNAQQAASLVIGALK